VVDGSTDSSDDSFYDSFYVENGRPWAAVGLSACSIGVRRQAGHQQDFWHIGTCRGYR
jgi:hypothetical protein